MIQARQIVNLDQLYRFEDGDGRVFTMYCDIDRLEGHMLELSPVDAPFIKEFSRGLRQFAKFNLVPDKPPEVSSIVDKMKMVVSAADGHATIFDMLEGRYVNDTIRAYYDKLTIFQPLVYVGLGVNRTFDDLPQIISGLFLPLDKPLRIANKDVSQFLTHVYNFDPTLHRQARPR